MLNTPTVPEGSAQINSQLVPQYPWDGIDPLIIGGTYTGPAMYPQQGVFSVPPVMPAPSDLAGQATVQGPPTATSGKGIVPAPTTADAAGNPMHITKGPVVFALLFLAISLIGLQWIHWRKG